MDVLAPIPFFDQPGLAGVQAHAHPDLGAFGPYSLVHGSLDIDHGIDGLTGFGKDDEEGVTLSVYLPTIPLSQSTTNIAMTPRDKDLILVSRALEQLG